MFSVFWVNKQLNVQFFVYSLNQKYVNSQSCKCISKIHFSLYHILTFNIYVLEYWIDGFHFHPSLLKMYIFFCVDFLKYCIICHHFSAKCQKHYFNLYVHLFCYYNWFKIMITSFSNWKKNFVKKFHLRWLLLLGLFSKLNKKLFVIFVYIYTISFLFKPYVCLHYFVKKIHFKMISYASIIQGTAGSFGLFSKLDKKLYVI